MYPCEEDNPANSPADVFLPTYTQGRHTKASFLRTAEYFILTDYYKSLDTR
jgi:hypothetical protein